MELLFQFCKSEQGGGLVEYTLIIAFIALAAVAAVTTLGTKVSTTINTVTPAL
jgi:pilus assembly protein Flp/PilA